MNGNRERRPWVRVNINLKATIQCKYIALNSCQIFFNARFLMKAPLSIMFNTTKKSLLSFLIHHASFFTFSRLLMVA
ncbi:hypothetical protein KsCSTR_48650 [Candidatus Kuenenia stuttgartiensis]|uniref:Uncharacterized protein n=1 Tax=Kuenenia stuttgartiensis TaxID=174633 RepID=A0A6G7GY15_KUEST|nr:hypothetical protein KsCSTR_48650 [Candidatus Kuenenia stuttgartiensis]